MRSFRFFGPQTRRDKDIVAWRVPRKLLALLVPFRLHSYILLRVGYVGYENVGYVSYVMYTCMFRGTPFFRAAYPYPAIY